MNAVLYEARGRASRSVYKDFAGGLGAGFFPGDSLAARLLERVKRWGINLPLPVFGQLAAILKAEGHGVRISFDGVPERADVVLIHSSLSDWPEELAACRAIKKGNSGTVVGFIGPLAALESQAALAAGADFVVEGEPEAAVREMAKSGRAPRGLVKSPAVMDLDSLPLPDWSIYADHRSFRYFPALKVFPVFPVLSSRGCAYQCRYCPYISHFKDWRYRSPESVVEEIARLSRDYGARGVVFRDPLFSLPMDRAEAIARGLIKRDLGVRLACETRVDCLTPELLDALYEAGLRSVNMGIESANEKTLESVKRGGISGDHQKKIVSYCDKKGINVTAFYILGFPQDTREDVAATVRYARELNTHVASFTVFTPLPGVAAAPELEARLTTKDYSRYDSFHLVYEHPNFSAAELEALMEEALVGYYFRPKYAYEFVRRMLR